MIYFITQGGEYVKIGVAINPESRMAELQTGNPVELKLWLVLPGGLKEERLLHHKLGASRVRGEWFVLNDDLKRIIAKYSALTITRGDEIYKKTAGYGSAVL